MSINENGGKEPYEGYMAVYDDAQRLHVRLALEGIEVKRQADLFEAQGKALHQIKECARVGFMSAPKATEEAFVQLWRKAFQFDL
jgi:hypothetical protein